MKLLVAGAARNIAQYWESTKKSLQTIFDSVDDYKCIIVESNSQDDTLQLLQDWATQDSRRNVISLGHLEDPIRTKRIAQARNRYMDFIEPYMDEFPYVLVVDLDDRLNIEPCYKAQLYTCFFRTDWDAVASNRLGEYYDLWALRSFELGISFDCWAPELKIPTHSITLGKTGITVTEYKCRISYLCKFTRNISQERPWILCQSAFGGMALYRSSAIRGRRYDGDTTCEHVSFHSGLRMFINPRFISG